MERLPETEHKKINPLLHFEMISRFTEMYRSFPDDQVAAREAACLSIQTPYLMGDIREGELFAGRMVFPAIYFTPQAYGDTGGFGYALDESRFIQLIDQPELKPKQKERLGEYLDFWRTRHSSYLCRKSYPDTVQSGLPSDNWTGESGIAFPLYRIAGTQLNYRKLLHLGVEGLKNELQKQSEKVQDDPHKHEFLMAALQMLDVFSRLCSDYALQARKMAMKLKGQKRTDMLILADALARISSKPPLDFRAAVQLSFLYCVFSGSQNYGRIDDYLGTYLAHDLDIGLIDQEEAARIMEGWWSLMIARNTPYDGRAIIGGRGRRNEESADRLAILAIKTAGKVKDILPQLTLRLYKGQNPILLELALDVLAQGSTFPMLYNDEVNIPAASKAFGIPEKIAENVIPFGCGEYMINHQSVGTPSSVLNLLKALEVCLHKGSDPLGQKETGKPGMDYRLDSYEQLLSCYKEQVEYYVDLLAEQEKIEYDTAGNVGSFLSLSVLYDNCIERGKALFSGGLAHLGGTLEIYGFTNAADSLTALKKVVYDEKLYSLDKVVEALDQDFEGYDQIRDALLNAPKYGNDLDEADRTAMMLHEHICSYTRSRAKAVRLDSYLVVNINNDANTTLGRYTAASADGRKAFTSMSNGNAPHTGMDRNGLTAMLNSLVKLNPWIHAGTVQNMKFSKELFLKYRDKVRALLRAYFEMGGTQAMITVVSRKELEDAIKNPEKYYNLVVRVGGFSARFVDLSPEVQQEILNRTLYE